MCAKGAPKIDYIVIKKDNNNPYDYSVFRASNFRWSNDILEEIGKLYESIVGRSGFIKGEGILDALATNIKNVQKLQAEYDKEKLNVRDSNFVKDAKELDKSRSNVYWSQYKELFARAFSSFIEDKLSAAGRKSEYLSYGSKNEKYEDFIAKPFPDGEERKAINKAFQNFFDTIEEETTEDGKARLYSLKRANKLLEKSIQQKFSSGNTSLHQVASGFKKIDFKKGTTNLDLGGGKYDEGTRYLENIGVRNLIFDPVNRDSRHNQEVYEAVANGGVDTVTCNNVLNVIGEKESRSNVILQSAKALKKGGVAYFTVYEGDRSGIGKQSQKDSWQENRKTADYIEEIKEHFADVSIRNNVISAMNPIVDGKISIWLFDKNFYDDRKYSLKIKLSSNEVKKISRVTARELERIHAIEGAKIPVFDKVGDLKRFIKNSIPEDRRKPKNRQTGWIINITGKSFSEIVNHPARRAHKEARFASIPILPKLIEIAKFNSWEKNRYGENAEYYYFDAPMVFDGEKYIAKLAFRRINEDYTLHYDHNLSTFEEYAAQERESGGAYATGETGAASETTPTATDSNNNINRDDDLSTAIDNMTKPRLHTIPDNRKFSIHKLYTGSAADYDKASTDFIGTGEGSQAFGWGLYASDNKKIAKWYAEKDVEKNKFIQIIKDI